MFENNTTTMEEEIKEPKKPIKKSIKKHIRPCQFCKRSDVCLKCDKIINCRELTDCTRCGDIYGRPLPGKKCSRILSSGALIINTFDPEPFVYMVYEKEGIGDPGGKFDPSKDPSPVYTAVREFKEELGNYIVISSQPYVDLYDDRSNIYRMHIMVHSPEHRVMSMFRTRGTAVSVKVPLKYLLNSPKWFRFSSRIQT